MDFINDIDIYYLTRYNLSRLLNIYACNVNRYKHFRKGYLTKFNIKSELKISRYNTISYFEDSLEQYLDSLDYETIYDRELKKIINSLSDICLLNLSSKPINLPEIDLIDLDDKFIEVD
jgi:hypothetical protein